jgi:hypothetical protein
VALPLNANNQSTGLRQIQQPGLRYSVHPYENFAIYTKSSGSPNRPANTRQNPKRHPCRCLPLAGSWRRVLTPSGGGGSLSRCCDGSQSGLEHWRWHSVRSSVLQCLNRVRVTQRPHMSDTLLDGVQKACKLLNSVISRRGCDFTKADATDYRRGCDRGTWWTLMMDLS